MIRSIHQSMVNSWLACGERFRRRYIEGDIIPPGIAARRGSGFHKGAEVNHRQKIASGSDLPLPDLQDAARDEYVRLVRDEGVFIPRASLSEKNSLLNEGLNQTIQAMEIYHSQIAPDIQPALVEQFAEADIGLAVPLAGTIDVSDANRRIIDLKLQKRKSQEWADRELQPSFYAVLYKSLTGNDLSAFVYEQVIPNKAMLREPLATKRGEADFRRLKRYLAAFLNDLKSGNFRPAEPGHWLCSENFCGYFRSCSYVN